MAEWAAQFNAADSPFPVGNLWPNLVKNLIGSVFICIYHKTTPNALWQCIYFLKLTDWDCYLSPVEYGLGSGDFFQCELNLFVVGELHRNLNPIQLG